MECSLSSLKKSIGSVAIGFSSSLNMNCEFIYPITLCLKHCNAVVDENFCEVRQLVSLKIETMSEWWM